MCLEIHKIQYDKIEIDFEARVMNFYLDDKFITSLDPKLGEPVILRTPLVRNLELTVRKS